MRLDRPKAISRPMARFIAAIPVGRRRRHLFGPSLEVDEKVKGRLAESTRKRLV